LKFESMFYLLTRNKFVGVRVSKGDALGLPLELTYTQQPTAAQANKLLCSVVVISLLSRGFIHITLL
jgi:hypothetical protein